MESRFQLTQDQVSCELDDELFLFSLGEGHYFRLNPVGAAVCKLLVLPRTESELVEAITAEFAVEPSICRPDIRRLLDELVEHRLIIVTNPVEVSGPSSSPQ